MQAGPQSSIHVTVRLLCGHLSPSGATSPTSAGGQWSKLNPVHNETHHYSGSYVSALRRYGLYDITGPAPGLVGVAVLSAAEATTERPVAIAG